MITSDLWRHGTVRIGFFEIAPACLTMLYLHFIPQFGEEKMFSIPVPDKYAAAKTMEQLITAYKHDGAKVIAIDGGVEL